MCRKFTIEGANFIQLTAIYGQRFFAKNIR
jgi:hypothetical protein